MLLNLTDLSAEPLHRQISNQLTEKILGRELSAGDELPQVRVLARQHRVSKNTVKRAYMELAEQGLVIRGSGESLCVADLSEEERQAVSVYRPMGYESQLRAIQSLSRELVSAFDSDRVRSLFVENIRSTLRATEVIVALREPGARKLTLFSSAADEAETELGADDPFMERMEKAETPLKLAAAPGEAPEAEPADGPGEPATGPGPLAAELAARGVAVVAPLRDRGRLLGFVALGRRAAGAPYTEESLNLLMVLANQFVTALVTSRLYVESLEKRQMEEELKMAHQLQADLLPGEWDNGDGFSLSAYTSPSRTVGGDFYDYFPIDDARLGLVIADASGKGMPAAMLISQIQAILKSGVGNGDTIVRTLASLNRHLERNTAARYFATLFYGIYNRRTGCLEFANAGHDFPILVRAAGEVEVLESTGPALGVLPEYDHKTETVRVGPGDCLLFYTDGITDATDANGKHYGEQRLRNLLIRNRHLSPREVIDLIKDDLMEFCGTGTLQDDRTLMVFKVETTDERKSDAAQSN
jgi:serine phosphatase RsbU (regulator of sigma subunit)/DNA-binding transcriptional regulator YhcF (GntR family)